MKKRMYKSSLCMFVAVLLLISMIIPSSAIDEVDTPITIIENVPAAITAILNDNPGLTVATSIPLYNTDDEIVAQYYIFSPTGYAIISPQGDAVEYSPTATREIPIDEKVYYGGPLSYFTKETDEYVDVYSGIAYDESVVEAACEAYSATAEREIVAVNSNGNIDTAAITYPTSAYTNYVPTAYSHSSSECGCTYDSICGTVAAAMLLKYYDDYIATGIVPSWIPDPATEQYEFIHYLITYIQADGPYVGTNVLEVTNGINTFIQHHHDATTYYGYYAEYIVLVSFEEYQPYIYSGRPAILGVSGDPIYESHWVLGYGYTTLYSNLRMYNYAVVCDGWGNDGVNINFDYMLNAVVIDFTT